MVNRGADAAGPVLPACRQWDPLGLARRLPSLGVGAWRSAPLLPWRVQCPVRVCAALAAGSGGFGPVPGVVSPPFPPSRRACPALRVAGRPVRVSLTLARCYAIPRGLCVPRAWSGCPSGSLRVPFACGCARADAASALNPHWVVWRAHLARSRHWALVGPFHVVRAPPRVPRRAVWVRYPRAVGAGVWVLGPYTVPLACTPCGGCVPRGWWQAVPLPGLGLCAPRGAGLWRSCAGERAGGGGGAVPPVCAAEGGL